MTNNLYNEFEEFLSLEEAVNFGVKYFSQWLKEFQVNGKYRMIYGISNFEYEFIKMSKGEDYAEKIKNESVVYYAFSLYCGGNLAML